MQFDKLMRIAKEEVALFWLMAVISLLSGSIITQLMMTTAELKSFVLYVLLAHYANPMVAQFVMKGGVLFVATGGIFLPAATVVAQLKQKKRAEQDSKLSQEKEQTFKRITSLCNDKVLTNTAKTRRVQFSKSSMAASKTQAAQSLVNKNQTNSNANGKTHVEATHSAEFDQPVVTKATDSLQLPVAEQQAEFKQQNETNAYKEDQPNNETTSFFYDANEEVSWYDLLEQDADMPLDDIIGFMMIGLKEVNDYHLSGVAHGQTNIHSFRFDLNSHRTRLVDPAQTKDLTTETATEDLKLFLRSVAHKVRTNSRLAVADPKYGKLVDFLQYQLNFAIPQLVRQDNISRTHILEMIAYLSEINTPIQLERAVARMRQAAPSA